MDDQITEMPEPAPREPVFNIPSVIPSILIALALVHFFRENLLDRQDAIEFLFRFSFIPAQYLDPQLTEFSETARFWSPVTYSFLHADWTHYLVNGFWLLAFGGVVAKRMGWQKFVVLFLLGALAGALFHYVTHYGEAIPMIGASASVSACVGAAARFAFPASARFFLQADRLPRQSLRETFSNRQVIIFISIWFLINMVAGSGLIGLDGNEGSVAWEAHIGGFLAGLFCFGFFDQD